MKPKALTHFSNNDMNRMKADKGGRHKPEMPVL